MPTIIKLKGWRISFFANEGNEPIHVHCNKSSSSCKFWILPHIYDIRAEYLYGVTPKDVREIRKIIFDNYYTIVEAWDSFQERRNNG